MCRWNQDEQISDSCSNRFSSNWISTITNVGLKMTNHAAGLENWQHSSFGPSCRFSSHAVVGSVIFQWWIVSARGVSGLPAAFHAPKIWRRISSSSSSSRLVAACITARLMSSDECNWVVCTHDDRWSHHAHVARLNSISSTPSPCRLSDSSNCLYYLISHPHRKEDNSQTAKLTKPALYEVPFENKKLSWCWQQARRV